MMLVTKASYADKTKATGHRPLTCLIRLNVRTRTHLTSNPNATVYRSSLSLSLSLALGCHSREPRGLDARVESGGQQSDQIIVGLSPMIGTHLEVRSVWRYLVPCAVLNVSNPDGRRGSDSKNSED